MNAHARLVPGMATQGDVLAQRDQRVSTMKSVPLPVSGPSPWSEMISEAPGDISSEIRSNASGGILTRSSASVAFDAGRGGAGGGWTCLPLADFLARAHPVPGIDTTVQRSVVLSSFAAKAGETWVSHGPAGSPEGTGT